MPREAMSSGGETELTQCNDSYGIVDLCHAGLQHKFSSARDPLLISSPNTCIPEKNVYLDACRSHTKHI